MKKDYETLLNTVSDLIDDNRELLNKLPDQYELSLEDILYFMSMSFNLGIIYRGLKDFKG